METQETMESRIPTIVELRAAAKERDATIEVDRSQECYRATANDGRRWESGLHELVATWGPQWDRRWRRQAREELLADMLEYQDTEVCDDPTCDWCHPNTHPVKEKNTDRNPDKVCEASTKMAHAHVCTLRRELAALRELLDAVDPDAANWQRVFALSGAATDIGEAICKLKG